VRLDSLVRPIAFDLLLECLNLAVQVLDILFDANGKHLNIMGLVVKDVLLLCHLPQLLHFHGSLVNFLAQLPSNSVEHRLLLVCHLLVQLYGWCITSSCHLLQDLAKFSCPVHDTHL